MSAEPRKISNEIIDEGIGSLGGCFVDGNPEQRSRERKLRRRSLAISILLQAAVLAAVILIPLFGKTEHITYASVPIPPYYHHGAPKPINPTQAPTDGGRRLTPCFFCPTAPTSNRPTIGNNTSSNAEGAVEIGDPNPCVGCVTIDTPTGQPQPPIPVVDKTKPKTLRVTNLDPALLRHRVAPVYPTLPRQMRREGRVELHALIAIDGTIQSLEAVGGDPMFFDSAMQAVQQWIYKPTYLNEQPVQIETTITVIYTLAQ